MLVAKIKAQREAEKNKPKKQKSKIPPPDDFPPVGGNNRMGGFPSLGGVGQRQGGFDFDPEYLKRAQADLDRLNFDDNVGRNNEPEDKRSMLEIMREKRAKAEAENEERKRAVDDGAETVE